MRERSSGDMVQRSGEDPPLLMFDGRPGEVVLAAAFLVSEYTVQGDGGSIEVAP
jgi:hypothetical protein